MAKVIRLETQQLKEARLVAGMFAGNPLAQNELYRYCADYYYENIEGCSMLRNTLSKTFFRTLS